MRGEGFGLVGKGVQGQRGFWRIAEGEGLRRLGVHERIM